MPMQNSSGDTELKRLLLDEDYHGHEICDMVESDPRTFFALAELLKDKDPKVRAESIPTIWNATYTNQQEFYLREVHHTVAPLVLALLKDPYPEVRSSAANSVSQFPGVQGAQLLREATPRLLELLNDPDISVRESAGWSLWHAALSMAENDPESTLHILSLLATHSSAKVRRNAAWIPDNSAHKFAAIRNEIISLLSSLARDPEQTVREHAQNSLKSFASAKQPQEKPQRVVEQVKEGEVKMSQQTPEFSLRVALSLITEVQEKTESVQRLLQAAKESHSGSFWQDLKGQMGAYGEVARLENDLNQAISLANQVMQTHPGFVFEDSSTHQRIDPSEIIGLATFQMGLVALAQNDLNAALGWFQKSVQIQENQTTRYNIGYTLLQQGRSQEATRVFQRVIEMNPETELAIEAGKILTRISPTPRLQAIQSVPATKEETFLPHERHPWLKVFTFAGIITGILYVGITCLAIIAGFLPSNTDRSAMDYPLRAIGTLLVGGFIGLMFGILPVAGGVYALRMTKSFERWNDAPSLAKVAAIWASFAGVMGLCSTGIGLCAIPLMLLVIPSLSKER